MEEYWTGTRVPGSPEPPGLPERSWVGDGEGRVIPNFPPPSNCLKLPGRPQVRASQCTQSSQGVDPEPVWFVSQLRSRLRASYLTSLYWVPMTPPSEGGWKIERAHVHRCANTSVAILWLGVWPVSDTNCVPHHLPPVALAGCWEEKLSLDPE